MAKQAAVETRLFNYKNLTGQEYLDYEEMVSQLPRQTIAQFELYEAAAIMGKKFDSNLEKVSFVEGIKLKKDEPVATTHITPHIAMEFNRQIEQNTAHNMGRYYLLKQN